MKRSWIKLYIEILDDPKMGRLPDALWRRAVEIFLLAGELDADGVLPSVDDIAWRLRISVDEVEQVLQQLSKIGIVNTAGGEWVVSHFKDRQFSESYERVKRYRNAKSNGDGNGEETENESPSSSSSPSLSSSEFKGGEGVGEEPIIPETPKEAMSHPDILVYQAVSGRFPGHRDYRAVIETIHALREKHGDKLQEYLLPFWTAWSTRKTKDHRPYSPTSLVWLCEWALQNDIPRANGHEPTPGETNNTMAAIEKVANNARKNR